MEPQESKSATGGAESTRSEASRAATMRVPRTLAMAAANANLAALAAANVNIVDIHTHMFPPAYVRLLEARTTIPLIHTFPSSPVPRFVILKDEAAALEKALKDPSAPLPGRPLTDDYTSLDKKIQFMDNHKINISVLTLTNPWLDFFNASDSPAIAKTVNEDFSALCARHPGRLYFLAAPPLSAPVQAILASIDHFKKLKYVRGVVMGSRGLGKGLDDPDLLPVFKALAAAHLPIFLHPHYGLPVEVFGSNASASGHVLPIALGFPMETTIAASRMYLAGVFDKVPDLRMILAHSGGTIPFLAGRMEMTIRHDESLVGQGKVGPDRRTIWDLLKQQVYLDSVDYSAISLKAAIQASDVSRLLFGSDHPFFPPLTTDKTGEWESFTENIDAVDKAVGKDSKEAKAILGENAMRILRLTGE